MKFINKKMVVVINRIAVQMTGGKYEAPNNILPGRTLNFVENIHTNELFGSPIYQDIFHQAAAYMFYISKNHIFRDGNKRTALATACTFLEWNQITLAPFNEDSVFDFVVSIAEGENNPDSAIPRIANWFKEMSVY